MVKTWDTTDDWTHNTIDDIEELSEEEVAAVNEFDAEEDVVVEVPKEDVKPTTIVVERRPSTTVT